MLGLNLSKVLLLLLTFFLATKSEDVISRKKNESGEEIIKFFFSNLTQEMRESYANYHLLCNCTKGCASNGFTGNLGGGYRNICFTDGACVKQVSGDHRVVLNCLRAELMVGCKTKPNELHSMACCNDYHFCNSDLEVVFKGSFFRNSELSPFYLPGVIALVLLAVVFIGVFFVFLAKRSKQRCSFLDFKQLCQRKVTSSAMESEELIKKPFVTRANRLIDRITSSIAESSKTELTDFCDSDSGSGSGLPGLIQRTVARQVELSTSVGKGRFGEVYLGYWRGEAVAVKVFNSRDEKSWKREIEIYETTWLRHPNILAYIASDIRATKKPAIAHRDIKSKNILVRTDLSCAIADFGLAVRYQDGEVDLPNNAKCGTTRYLSPELLSDDYDLTDFEAHKRSDVYSMALVIWELLRRCDTNGNTSTYEVPYFEYCPCEPSLEEMRKCVLIEKRRPSSCAYWKENFFASEMFRIICESWAECPTNRHTAASVRIAIDRLIAYYGWNE